MKLSELYINKNGRLTHKDVLSDENNFIISITDWDTKTTFKRNNKTCFKLRWVNFLTTKDYCFS